MKLNAQEIGTPLWTKLVEHYSPMLAKLRARAENPELPEAQRIPLLWQVRHIKDFLELAQPASKREKDAG